MNNTNDQTTFLELDYGSRLYGTATPTSDTDRKSIYLPSLGTVLLGKKQDIYKLRYDAAGNKIGVNDTMPDNGVETEYIPLQRFARDFLGGQTYAQEVAYGYLVLGEPGTAYNFVEQLVQKFANADVYSMVGFAKKQTLDYVKRGERMNVLSGILVVLRDFQNAWKEPTVLRLDTVWNGASDHTGKPDYVFDLVARRTGLPTGTTVNNNKSIRTLEMNGRQYLETTTVEHLVGLLEQKVSEYGDRTVEASKNDVDWKSLSHAVRVYQQAIELCSTGTITFPRPNRDELLAIKRAQVPTEQVKELLIKLDAEVLLAQKTTKLPKRDEAMLEELDFWLLGWLHDFYDLS